MEERIEIDVFRDNGDEVIFYQHKLSDGSKVYGVTIRPEYSEDVADFGCVSSSHASELFKQLKRCS